MGIRFTIGVKTKLSGKINPVTRSTNTNKDHNYCKKRKHEDHIYCKTEETPLQPQTGSVILPSTSMHITQCIEDPLTTGSAATPSTSMHILQCIDDPPISGVFPSSSQVDTKTISSTMQDVTTPKRKHVISKVKTLTPNCAKLYKHFKNARRQLSFTRRAKEAIKFSKQNEFEKITQHMNPLAKKLMWMQIKQCTKSARGRRFSHEEKLIALSILKQSPKCYKFLHRIFILPSKHTLNRMISGLRIEAGINSQIFNAVKKEVDAWEEPKKYCCIIFDEVALDTGVTYDRHKDIINGFVHVDERLNDFADHALVFMLRGAVHKWQQPVSFNFCKGATKGYQLKKILKEMIVAVCDTGLLPIAIVCDQGSAFQSTLKSLQEDTRRMACAGERNDDVIQINGHVLNIIYDPPHLIKGLRNNFITKNINQNGKISKWSDIVDVYNTDCNHAQMRLLHKLNDEHVIPEKIKKMKVKNCVQVFSKTVAATLSYTAQFSHYADGSTVSSTLRNTAEIVSFFDDLFDSVNGASLYSAKTKGKPLRRAVTETSPHHQFWKEAIEKLKKLRFVDKHGKETSVPSLKNWLTTLKSFQNLWQFFKNKNLKIMRPRFFNFFYRFFIENFFGQVRAYNFRNNDPNCHTFTSTFRSLLITRFINFHNNAYNCEEDSGKQLIKLKNLFEPIPEGTESSYIGSSSNLSKLPESSGLENVSHERFLLSARQEQLHVHSRAYTTGWVVRKIVTKIKCSQCESDLSCNDSTAEKSNTIRNWIHYREFKLIKSKKLTYPSEKAVRSFGIITEEANILGKSTTNY